MTDFKAKINSIKDEIKNLHQQIKCKNAELKCLRAERGKQTPQIYGRCANCEKYVKKYLLYDTLNDGVQCPSCKHWYV